MLCAVALLLHVLPLAALEVSTTLPPWQKVVGPFAVMAGEGVLFTVTVTGDDVPVHPNVLVTETVYTPEEVTVMFCVFAFVLQVLPVAKLELSITLPPEQNVTGPFAVTTGEGLLFTVTATVADVPVQPLTSVTVTE